MPLDKALLKSNYLDQSVASRRMTSVAESWLDSAVELRSDCLEMLGDAADVNNDSQCTSTKKDEKVQKRKEACNTIPMVSFSN